MTPLTDQQVHALRDLIGLWGMEAFVLVGASALGFFLQFRWRKTEDLDLSVMIPIQNYPAGLETLQGWKPDPRLEQRWHAPGNVAIDFAPIDGPTDATEIFWPKSGFRMSIVGFRLAFEQAKKITLASDVCIQVAPPAALTILKMVAYLDRPQERGKDLEDLVHLLDEYAPADHDRRFSSEVVDLQLDYDDVGAYLLGSDIAKIAGVHEFGAVASFVARSLDPRDSTATLAKMARVGPRPWRDGPERLVGRLRAFEQGLEGHRRTD